MRAHHGLSSARDDGGGADRRGTRRVRLRHAERHRAERRGPGPRRREERAGDGRVPRRVAGPPARPQPVARQRLDGVHADPRPRRSGRRGLHGRSRRGEEGRDLPRRRCCGRPEQRGPHEGLRGADDPRRPALRRGAARIHVEGAGRPADRRQRIRWQRRHGSRGRRSRALGRVLRPARHRHIRERHGDGVRPRRRRPQPLEAHLRERRSADRSDVVRFDRMPSGYVLSTSSVGVGERWV